ncbi:hypothetical protein [Lacibacter sediminis]|uniref:Uncharacterized protein n=1 Tax=Lacibacter sediminis TaxID=2760713 RepID=A0A7G5XFN9_9BACT|nr:hypothetical protein [Lacibacter sediminis]QNA44292.1 hypothetical protein H4075_19855 [Lacibacter sediminis]
MQEYQYFKQSGNPEVHAALVGISKQDWICVRFRENTNDAISTMSKYQFDILPKMNKDSSIDSYYRTVEWGKYSAENILLKKIESADKLYYLTNIRDVIRLMFESKRNFFFLTNHSEIVGLISISNLNCKHVALYYFNLINTLERRMGKFIHQHLATETILGSLQKLGEEKQIPSALDTVKRYKGDALKGLDGSIIEYLYLSDLFLLACEHHLYKLLGYKKQQDFDKRSGLLRGLRNAIAHPNKSLVKGPLSLNDLWKSSVKINELDERLSSLNI